MTPKCQTLSEYIKRRQMHQNLKLAKFDTNSSLVTDKEVTDIVQKKKEKVHLIMSQIFNEVKRSNRNSSHLSLLEKMISNAEQQINLEIQNACSQIHNRLKEKESCEDSNDDKRSQVSIGQRLHSKNLKEKAQNVLREVKTQNHIFDSSLKKAKSNKKQEINVRKNRQVQERTRFKMQNQKSQGKKVKNPEQQQQNEKSLFYTFSGGKGFDSKQNFRSSIGSNLGSK